MAYQAGNKIPSIMDRIGWQAAERVIHDSMPPYMRVIERLFLPYNTQRYREMLKNNTNLIDLEIAHTDMLNQSWTYRFAYPTFYTAERILEGYGVPRSAWDADMSRPPVEEPAPARKDPAPVAGEPIGDGTKFTSLPSGPARLSRGTIPRVHIPPASRRRRR